MIQPSDPWAFDEEPVETWAEILGAQAPDLLWLSAFLLLALVSFRLRSVRLKYATLVVAVAYMGFAKSHLISVTNIFSLIDGNLPVFKYNLAFYLFVAFTIVSTILWGRLYCGRVCAFGALTQLMDATLPDTLRVNVPRALERRAAWIKFGLLAATIAYFAVTRDMLIYRYVEPFWMFGMFATPPLWVGLSVLLMATVFVRNLYCRFLCPVGATLGLLSYLAVFRIKRWSECHTCRICQKACQWGAIDGPRILVTECVRCDDCERLYADEAKCPHWRILAYRQRKIIALTPVPHGASGGRAQSP
ncbi:MAG: 4Fe-4S binding protein [Acidobacteria bacterium]|nr:4Fe-4S binding protein [Acidobacteriota bacterium]